MPCLEYLAQRRGRSPRADVLRGVRIRFLARNGFFCHPSRQLLFPPPVYSAGGAILNVCTTYCGLAGVRSNREAVSMMSVEILRSRLHDGLRLVFRGAFTVPSTSHSCLLSFIMTNPHAAMIDQVAQIATTSHTLIICNDRFHFHNALKPKSL
jgi:hypothetical protein